MQRKGCLINDHPIIVRVGVESCCKVFKLAITSPTKKLEDIVSFKGELGVNMARGHHDRGAIFSLNVVSVG